MGEPRTKVEKVLDVLSGEEKVKTEVTINPNSLVLFGVILLITWILIFSVQVLIVGRKT